MTAYLKWRVKTMNTFYLKKKLKAKQKESRKRNQKDQLEQAKKKHRENFKLMHKQITVGNATSAVKRSKTTDSGDARKSISNQD